VGPNKISVWGYVNPREVLTHRAAFFVQDSQLVGREFPVNSLFRPTNPGAQLPIIRFSDRCSEVPFAKRSDVSLIFSLLIYGRSSGAPWSCTPLPPARSEQIQPSGLQGAQTFTTSLAFNSKPPTSMWSESLKLAYARYAEPHGQEVPTSIYSRLKILAFVRQG